MGENEGLRNEVQEDFQLQGVYEALSERTVN